MSTHRNIYLVEPSLPTCWHEICTASIPGIARVKQMDLFHPFPSIENDVIGPNFWSPDQIEDIPNRQWSRLTHCRVHRTEAPKWLLISEWMAVAYLWHIRVLAWQPAIVGETLYHVAVLTEWGTSLSLICKARMPIFSFSGSGGSIPANNTKSYLYFIQKNEGFVIGQKNILWCPCLQCLWP